MRKTVLEAQVFLGKKSLGCSKGRWRVRSATTFFSICLLHHLTHPELFFQRRYFTSRDILLILEPSTKVVIQIVRRANEHLLELFKFALKVIRGA